MIAQLILGLLLACSLLGQTRVELTKQVKGELPPDKGGTGVSSCLENEGLVWQSGEFACSALASGPHAPTHQHGGTDEVGSAIPAANEIPKAGVGGSLAEGWLPTTVSQDMTWTGGHEFKTVNGVRASTAFDWSQGPASSLAAGANTVMLSPCPAGVDGAPSHTAHELFINNSNNSLDETVSLTGGTCASEASSGTISFTAVNAHSSGQFTIESATAGIQEAINAGPDRGARTIIPAGTHNLEGTIHVGNGTISAFGTKNQMTIMGMGDGAGLNEAALGGATHLSWVTPDAKTMIHFHGPVSQITLRDLFLNGNNVAATGVHLFHAHRHNVQRLTIVRVADFGMIIDAHPSPSLFATGGGNGYLQDVHITNLPVSSVTGFLIGSNDRDGGPTAGLQFFRAFVRCGAGDTGGIGFRFRFTDSHTLYAPSAANCGKSYHFDPPDNGGLGRTNFPNQIVLIHAEASATPSAEANWTGNRKIWFMPLLQEEDGMGRPQPPFPDIKGVGGYGENGGWVLDNTADQVALKVKGHSTQTANLFEIENATGTDLFTVDNSGIVQSGTLTHAALPAANNGSVVYCSNCGKGSDPCLSGGSGALAVRANGGWQCL